MPKPSDTAVHGQWRMTIREIDNGSLYVTELAYPVLICKQYIRGYTAMDKANALIRRKAH